MRKTLVVGNWKMFGTRADLPEIEAIEKRANDLGQGVEVALCVPATLIAIAHNLGLTRVRLGGQTCHQADQGAHTGEVSARMLADCGASYVILGHSERRADQGETDEQIAAKLQAARRNGLVAIVCVGETLSQRDAGEERETVARQLDGAGLEGFSAGNLVIAYEPVWAIGTGRTPSIEDIADMHGFISQALAQEIGAGEAERVRILYGGSVKPANAAEIFAAKRVDGALVGGASLKAADFNAILDAAGRA